MKRQTVAACLIAALALACADPAVDMATAGMGGELDDASAHSLADTDDEAQDAVTYPPTVALEAPCTIESGRRISSDGGYTETVDYYAEFDIRGWSFQQLGLAGLLGCDVETFGNAVDDCPVGASCTDVGKYPMYTPECSRLTQLDLDIVDAKGIVHCGYRYTASIYDVDDDTAITTDSGSRWTRVHLIVPPPTRLTTTP